jgi:hypothetical protein
LFSPDPPVSSANKTDRHDITEIFFESGDKYHKPNQTNLKIKSTEKLNKTL